MVSRHHLFFPIFHSVRRTDVTNAPWWLAALSGISPSHCVLADGGDEVVLITSFGSLCSRLGFLTRTTHSMKQELKHKGKVFTSIWLVLCMSEQTAHTFTRRGSLSHPDTSRGCSKSRGVAALWRATRGSCLHQLGLMIIM